MKFNIGEGSSIHLGCHFTAIGNFYLGKNSTINQYCRIDNRGGICIENNVSISPKVDLLTADHNVYSNQCEGREKAIFIKDYVFVGSNAMILPGITLEKGSVLGAKSLLTKSTLQFGIYIGLPAKHVGNRPNNPNYQSSYVRWFH